MKALIVALTAPALTLTLAGCSSDSSGSKAPQTAVTQSTSPSSNASSARASASGSGSNSGTSFAMPDETGKILQKAQDDVQRVSGNPFYISFSDDALGTGRHQLVDSNWKVCSQTPLPGVKVSPTTEVRFKTVKLDENCP